LDPPLVQARHANDFEVAIETNGSLLPPSEVDWICVSPKAGARLLLASGDELKLVYPQIGAEPEHFGNFNFHHFFLQPMDGPDKAKNTKLAMAYCLSHPNWRLSVQTHKLLGIP
jgi:7-carboxy-7-deazaguanine synthase